ncbi:hypothetical protein [Herbiconiux ginsengi]|uniref:Uncharacterized protein n=1 Tax=Herbiconiux ginsengi TaxID=381665 RepID=A0A1H3RJZ8_9MICO|nr:hypothetical protein [Herbiconiux ginsengi]SDZ25950.1 hypothetical protein SAMN05216554_2866 [Herbiconiux ginsengi]
MSGTSESDLIEEARAALGESEEIRVAGIFGLANLVVAQAVGLAAGSAASGVDVAVGADVGGGLGAFVATKAAAEAQGVTVQLIVAVNDDTIHVLNRDTGGRLRAEVASFPRATTEVRVEKFGLSRQLTLTEPATGDSIQLHGSVSWIVAQSTGDRLVLDLLGD